MYGYIFSFALKSLSLPGSVLGAEDKIHRTPVWLSAYLQLVSHFFTVPAPIRDVTHLW